MSKENVTPYPVEEPQVSGLSKGSLSPVKRKSLIPVPSPKRSQEDNTDSSFYNKRTSSSFRSRTPLAPVQRHSLSTPSKMMVGGGRADVMKETQVLSPSKKTAAVTNRVVTVAGGGPGHADSPIKSSPAKASTPLLSVRKTAGKGKLGLKKIQMVDKEIQTEHPDIQMIIGDEPPPAYWKELAETRRKALEDALNENEALHKKIEDLLEEKEQLENIVEQAKSMAEYIESLTEDSGVGADASVSIDQSISISHENEDEDGDNE